MAGGDQTGTTNNSFSLTFGSNPYPKFPFTPTSGYWFSKSMVYKGYMYACLCGFDSTGGTNANVGVIYRINTTNIELNSWQVYLAAPTAMQFAPIIFDETAGNIYCIGYLANNTKSTSTYVCNIDLGAVWNNGAIADACSSATPPSLVALMSGESNRYSATIKNSVLYYISGYSAYNPSYFRQIFKTNLDRNLPTKQIPEFTSSQTSVAINLCGIEVYGSNVYLFSGYNSTNFTQSGSPCVLGTLSYASMSPYSTSAVHIYNTVTDTWSISGMTPIPGFAYSQTSFLMCGSVVYVFDTSNYLQHYYDLSLGTSSFWNIAPPVPSTFNSRCTMAFDKENSRILALDTNGSMYILKLDPITYYPKDISWNSTLLSFGTVSSIQSGAVNIPFTLSSVLYDQRQTGTANIAFSLSTSGLRISTHTGLQYSPVDFPLQSESSAVQDVQIPQSGTTEILFTFLSSGSSSTSYFESASGEIDLVAGGIGYVKFVAQDSFITY